MLVVRRFLVVLGMIVYASATTTQDCSSPADIVFLLDASTSVWFDNFDKMKDFVVNITRIFKIGPNTVQIGVATFSTTVENEFYLSDFTTNLQVEKAIQAIDWMTGGTRTDLALADARTHIFQPDVGDRPGIPNFLILMTDGESNQPKLTVAEAELIKKQGDIEVFAIGIGAAVKLTELQEVATSAKDVFVSSSFDTLYTVADTIQNSVCNSSAAATTVSTKTTTETTPTTVTTTPTTRTTRSTTQTTVITTPTTGTTRTTTQTTVTTTPTTQTTRTTTAKTTYRSTSATATAAQTVGSTQTPKTTLTANTTSKLSSATTITVGNTRAPKPIPVTIQTPPLVPTAATVGTKQTPKTTTVTTKMTSQEPASVTSSATLGIKHTSKSTAVTPKTTYIASAKMPKSTSAITKTTPHAGAVAITGSTIIFKQTSKSTPTATQMTPIVSMNATQTINILSASTTIVTPAAKTVTTTSSSMRTSMATSLAETALSKTSTTPHSQWPNILQNGGSSVVPPSAGNDHDHPPDITHIAVCISVAVLLTGLLLHFICVRHCESDKDTLPKKNKIDNLPDSNDHEALESVSIPRGF